MFEHAERHGRHCAPDGDVLALDQIEHLAGVKTSLEEDHRVTAQHRQQQSLDSADVEHGAALKDHGAALFGIQLLRQAARYQQQAVQVGDHRAMGEHGCLGVACGAGGEDDQGGVVLVTTGCHGCWDRFRLAPAPNLIHEDNLVVGQARRQQLTALLVGDHHRGLNQLDGVLGLGAIPPSVSERDDGAGPNAGPERRHPLGRVGSQQEQPVAGLQGPLGQLARHAVGGEEEVAKRQSAAALY